MKTKIITTLAVLLVSSVTIAAPTVEQILSEYAFTEVNGSVDQLWYDLNGGVTFKAKYAGDDHILGINYYGDNGFADYIWLDGANDDGIFAAPDVDHFDLDNGRSFMFVLKDLNSGLIWYSDPTKNVDGMDHMRTFDTGLVDDHGHTIYAIAFEDLHNDISDWDYNDNVILVSGASPVPAPSAILLAGLGLTMVSRFRHKK